MAHQIGIPGNHLQPQRFYLSRSPKGIYKECLLVCCDFQWVPTGWTNHAGRGGFLGELSLLLPISFIKLVPNMLHLAGDCALASCRSMEAACFTAASLAFSSTKMPIPLKGLILYGIHTGSRVTSSESALTYVGFSSAGFFVTWHPLKWDPSCLVPSMCVPNKLTN